MAVACFSLDFVRNQMQYKSESGTKERKFEMASV